MWRFSEVGFSLRPEILFISQKKNLLMNNF